MLTRRTATRAGLVHVVRAAPGTAAVTAATTLLAAALIPAPARAQVPADVPRPTHVPIEFVELLALNPFSGFGGPGGAEVLVERLPEDLFEVVRPGPGWRVVGSMVYPMMSISALVAPGDPDALEREWGVRLREAGWRTQQSVMEPGVGFLASAADETMDLRQLCAPDNSAMLAITAASRDADSVVVTVVRVSGMMAGSCAAGGMRAATQREEMELPILTPPEGVTLGRRGSSSGGGEPTSYARARTDLPPATLLEHYAAQMEDAGWLPDRPVVGDDVAAQTFTRGDPPGTRPVSAVLTATRLSNGEVDLHLRVLRAGR
jgi:hypothetical protein